MNEHKDISYDKFVTDLCGFCHKDSNLKCSGCNISSYCSKKCQKKDWENHQMLMGCSLVKDENDQKNQKDKEKPTDVSSNINLKIRYGELVKAMIVLRYSFTNSDSDLMYGGDEDAEKFIECKVEAFHKEDLPIYIEYPFEAFFDTKFFTAYKGDVFLQSQCMVFGKNRGKSHTQDPIKIANVDKDLTPRHILKIIEEAVAVDRSDENKAENVRSNLRPFFVCSMHNTLEEIQVCQSRYGVLIRMLCS